MSDEDSEKTQSHSSELLFSLYIACKHVRQCHECYSESNGTNPELCAAFKKKVTKFLYTEEVEQNQNPSSASKSVPAGICGQNSRKLAQEIAAESNKKCDEKCGMMQNLPGIRGIINFAEYCGFGPNHEICCIVYLLGSRTVQITYRIMERTA